MSHNKNRITIIILMIVIPVTVLLSAAAFREKYYAFISVLVALLSCIPLFYAFERRENSSRELAVLAVLIALSSLGRFIFAPLPGFKPITAITVIVAVWLGKEAGFVVGSLSAVISNFYFGQGPWTPFQMFAWGFLGFLAGILSNPLKRNKIMLSLYGLLAGVSYSLIMDVWTTLWADGTFNISRYLASVITALPVTAEYAISNVVFLLLLSKPIGEKLERLKNKYGMFAVN